MGINQINNLVSAKSELRRDFTDDKHWIELAWTYFPNRRLPAWSERCELTRMRDWLRRLRIKETKYEAATGTTLQEFIDLNPGWGLRPFVGLLLEMKAQ